MNLTVTLAGNLNQAVDVDGGGSIVCRVALDVPSPLRTLAGITALWDFREPLESDPIAASFGCPKSDNWLDPTPQS